MSKVSGIVYPNESNWEDIMLVSVGDTVKWDADIYVECKNKAHYVCTAPKDHAGPHIAQDGADEVVAVWA